MPRTRSLAGQRTFAQAGPKELKPRTLVSIRGRIEGFAQDGGWIVWADAEAPCHRQVLIRRVRGGRPVSLVSRRGSLCLGETYFAYQHRMALAGTRALWVLVGAGNTVYYYSVQTSSLGEPRSREVGNAEVDKRAFVPVPFGADGPTLVHAGGGRGDVSRVVRGVEHVPRTVGTVALAASGRAFAVARLLPAGCACSGVFYGRGNWSPDGRRILFGSARHSLRFQDIYVIEGDGTDERQLTRGLDAWGKWSPDATRLLLFDGVGGSFQLVVLDLASGRRHMVGQRGFAAGYATAEWSPNGRQIAFVRSGESHRGLYLAAAEGSGVRRLASGRIYGGPYWSSDGRWIAFSRDDGGRTGLYVAAAAGSRVRRLFAVAESDSAVWSPARAEIAVIAGGYRRKALYVASADGPSMRRLTDVPTDLSGSYARWSPDGKWIALYLAEVSRNSLYLAAADGSSIRRIAENTPFDWSPDASEIAFTLKEGDDTTLYAAAADGSRVRRLLADGGSPHWSPDGTRIAVGSVGGITIVTPTGGVLGSIPKARFREWSPDGARLLYESGEYNVDLELGVAAADGSSSRALTRTTADPPWQGVEVRNTFSGAVLARFAVEGKPRAVALSSARIAVLVEQGRSKRIELRGRGGKLERSVSVPAVTDAELSTAGPWIVFRTGRTIRLLDARNGRTSVLAVAREIPVGLSIEGRRVAWAEQTTPSRIRAIFLPKRYPV
jgi:Tol biopolymer transport system component